MILVIAGGRDIPRQYAARQILKSISRLGIDSEITEIIHGGCRGVDVAAGDVACGRWPVKIYEALWSSHGRSAGPARNRLMAKHGDALLLVWDGKSRGSANMKSEMLRLGKPVYEQIVNGES